MLARQHPVVVDRLRARQIVERGDLGASIEDGERGDVQRRERADALRRREPAGPERAGVFHRGEEPGHADGRALGDFLGKERPDLLRLAIDVAEVLGEHRGAHDEERDGDPSHRVDPPPRRTLGAVARVEREGRERPQSQRESPVDLDAAGDIDTRQFGKGRGGSCLA